MRRRRIVGLQSRLGGMAKLALILFLLLLLLEVSVVVATTSEEEKEPTEEGTAAAARFGDTATPSNDLEGFNPTEEEVHTMKAFCNGLVEDLNTLLADRAESHAEVLVFQKFFTLAEHLETETQRLQRDHTFMTCDETKSILRHESAATYVRMLKGLIDGSGEGVKPEGIPLSVVAAKVANLKERLETMHVVNDEVLHDLSNIVDVLKRLEDLEVPVNEAMQAVMDATEDAVCAEKFALFLDQAHSIQPHELPQWPTIAEGIGSLVQQCLTDHWVRGGDDDL